MKKTFPSFDLGIDHLFPSDPEERKQKKEEKRFFKVIFAFTSVYYNNIFKITFCFSKKCTIKLNANYMLQTAKASNQILHGRSVADDVLAVKCSKNDN